MKGSCQHGNRGSGPMTCWEILEKLSDWQLLNKDSAQWSYQPIMDNSQIPDTNKIRGILTMVFNTQNYWVSELCPTSRILNTRKNNVSETGSVSVLRWGDGDTYSVGSLRKSKPLSLETLCFLVFRIPDNGESPNTHWLWMNKIRLEVHELQKYTSHGQHPYIHNIIRTLYIYTHTHSLTHTHTQIQKAF
jgi:hypothetical protein